MKPLAIVSSPARGVSIFPLPPDEMQRLSQFRSTSTLFSMVLSRSQSIAPLAAAACSVPVGSNQSVLNSADPPRPELSLSAASFRVGRAEAE